jgi:hypothetical protein
MRKSTIVTTGILIFAFVTIVADITKQGYMVFTSVSDIKKTLPKFTPSQFASLLEGDSKGCLINGSQTIPITSKQTRTLRKLTDPKEIATLLGNPYCETDKGFRWILESGKTLNLKLNQTLDHDFSTDTPQSLTNKVSTPKATNGSVDQSVQRGLSTPRPSKDREPIKDK